MLRKTESRKQFANNRIVNKEERDDMVVDFSSPMSSGGMRWLEGQVARSQNVD